MSMYQIFVDNKLMHDDNIPNLCIYDPRLTLEQNAICKFQFSIVNTHPYYSAIERMSSKVEVYQDGELIFKGRVIEDGDDTYKMKEIYCESDIAFLLDSIQEPYTYEGSVRGFVELIINAHNSQVEDAKKFIVGSVTVEDPNDYIVRADTQYLDTWTTVKQKMIDLMGGYVRIRHEDDGTYFDYLSDFDTLNSQEIKFGENMLQVTKTQSAQDIYTVVVPLGIRDEETGERLTIESVNGGLNYLENADGIAQFGKIRKVFTFDDVTLPENLKTKGEQLLAEGVLITSSIEINAIDMANVNKDIRAFKLYSKIHVVSDFHGIDDYFVPLKMSIYPFKSENNKISLSSIKKTLTDDLNSSDVNVGALVSVVENVQNDYLVNIPNKLVEMQKEFTTQIEQTSTAIAQEVSEKYYSKEDTNTLISEVSTAFTQNKDYFEMLFNTFNQSLEDIQNGTNASFEDIRKFIRFEDGNIILGQVGNAFSVKITNERISFMQGVQEIAYVSNSKLYNTAVEILTSFQIGSFMWKPRANGNISFVKL